MRTQSYWIPAILGAVISFVSVQADLLVQERFEYDAEDTGLLLTNSALSGTSGTGWSGSWQERDANAGATFQSTDQFASAPPTGGNPALAGGASNKAGNRTGSNYRETTDLSTHFETGDTVWFSYLLALRHPYDGDFRMGFSDGLNAASGIGITIDATGTSGVNSTTGALHARINNTLSSSSVPVELSTDGFNTDGTNASWFIIGRFEKGAGTDQLDLWVNQGPAINPSTPTLSLSSSLSVTPNAFSFNSLSSTEAADGDIDDNTAFWVDEINLATTLEDIPGMSAVPEPSTCLLLLTGSLLVISLRRKLHSA